MDCREAKQWMSDAVDKRLERALEHAFINHLEECKDCWDEYDMERITKEVIRRRVPQVKAPVALTNRVVAMLASAPSSQSFRSGLQAVFASRALRYSLAAGFAVLLLLVGVSVFDHGPSSYGDVLANTQKNYDAMREGHLKPQMVAYEADRVQQYFDEQASFHVMVPAIEDCAYISGLISKLGDLQEAHILYKIDEETYLYCYQVDADKAIKGQMLNVPDEAIRMLNENKWYVKTLEDRTLMLWVSGNNLCAAVSSMHESEMMKILAAND
ncbi:MAG: zf-HC2 domain-containing protein [Bacteroidota bacterium]